MKINRPKIILLSGLVLLILIALFYLLQNSIDQTERTSLVLYGNVDIRQVGLGFRVKGKVLTMLREEGDRITPSDCLAELDPDIYLQQLTQAEQQYTALQAQLKNEELLRTRRDTLLGTGAVSAEEFDTIENTINSLVAQCKQAEARIQEAKIHLADTRLFSVVDGTILSRIEEPGAVVSEGAPVYLVSIPSPLWIRTYVAEPDLGLLRPGAPAEISTDTPANPTYRGHVGFISPVAEFTPKQVETTSLRTDLVYQVRIIVDNTDEGLRQGMPVTVKIAI